MTSDDHVELASGAVREAKQLFRQTGQPYYAVLAIAAAEDGRLRPPRWATKVVFEAVACAVFKHHALGCEISLDEALRLTTSPGNSPPSKVARRAIREHHVFADIRILHACFNLSIPAACELVHKEPDYSYARAVEDQLASLGPEKREELIDRLADNEVVAVKLRKGDYLAVTTGDRLGYEVEYLAEKYHRLKRRDLLPNSESPTRLDVDHHRGNLLLLCDTVRFSAISDVPSAHFDRKPLKRVPQRPAFKEFLEAGPKHSI